MLAITKANINSNPVESPVLTTVLMFFPFRVAFPLGALLAARETTANSEFTEPLLKRAVTACFPGLRDLKYDACKVILALPFTTS